MEAQNARSAAVDAYLALSPFEQRQVDFASKRLRESLHPPTTAALMPSHEEYLIDHGTPEELQAYYEASERAYERSGGR